MLEPVFKTANAEQLFTLEYYNPYLLSDTDPLWERLVKKEFRNTDRQELESWRDMYDVNFILCCSKCHEAVCLME